MSSLIVEVCQIDKVTPHPNPEVHSLELVHVRGWQCVTKKGQFQEKDRVVFIPPDSILPVETSDRLGVTTYLHKQRVKAIKLKGEPSYGIVLVPDDPDWKVGKDVAFHYGVTKYEPPPPQVMGRSGKGSGKFSDTLPDHKFFWKFTDMENMRHFPDLFEEGEEVVVTEKLHGTNTRCGYVRDTPQDVVPVFCVGSKNHRRKMPMKIVSAPKATGKFAWIKNACAWVMNGFKAPTMEIPDVTAIAASWFWYPTTLPSVMKMLNELSALDSAGMGRVQVELFGEVYGGGVQTLDYGTPENLTFAAFGLILDGHYVDYDKFKELCDKYGVPTVPLIYRGPFSLQKIKELSEGQTLATDKKQMREGVVVLPIKERTHPKCGRLILKYIGDEYLLAKEPDKKGNVKVSDFTEQ